MKKAFFASLVTAVRDVLLLALLVELLETSCACQTLSSTAGIIAGLGIVADIIRTAMLAHKEDGE